MPMHSCMVMADIHFGLLQEYRAHWACAADTTIHHYPSYQIIRGMCHLLYQRTAADCEKSDEHTYVLPKTATSWHTCSPFVCAIFRLWDIWDILDRSWKTTGSYQSRRASWRKWLLNNRKWRDLEDDREGKKINSKNKCKDDGKAEQVTEKAEKGSVARLQGRGRRPSECRVSRLLLAHRSLHQTLLPPSSLLSSLLYPKKHLSSKQESLGSNPSHSLVTSPTLVLIYLQNVCY